MPHELICPKCGSIMEYLEEDPDVGLFESINCTNEKCDFVADPADYRDED